MSVPQISVEELANYLTNSHTSTFQFIDVREPEEIAIAQIDGFINLPLSKFAEWSGQICTQLDPHGETLVICHHGMRSMQMCQWLMNQGFTNVKNIAGGIDAYASLIDLTIPLY